MIDFTDDELNAIASALDYFIELTDAVAKDPKSPIDEKISAAKDRKDATTAFAKIAKSFSDKGINILDDDVSLSDLGVFTNLR